MLAHFLAAGMTAAGWSAEMRRLAPAIRQPQRWPALAEAFRAADVVALVAPLYVDSLPAEMTQALEQLVTAGRAARTDQRLFALINSGFLEAAQNDVALEMCRLFARDVGLRWLGGLALGGGGGLNGQTLTRDNGPFKHVARALDLAVEAVAAGQAIPEAALALIRKPFCPLWMYETFANLGMMKGLMDQGMWRQRNARPYAR